MTFDDFATAMRAEGFVMHEIQTTARTPPVVFVRPLTGQVYCPRAPGELECRLSPNGFQGSPQWCGMSHALERARRREV